MKDSKIEIEKSIQEALELREKGKSIPEILSLFPEYRKELEEIFVIIEVLSSEKDKIKPSRVILDKIISQIPVKDNVTDPKINRYLDTEGKKGRPLIVHLSKIGELFNSMSKTTIILTGFLVVAVVVLAGIYLQPQEPEGTGSLPPGVKQEEMAKGNEEGASAAPSTGAGAVVDVSSLVDIEDEIGAELNGVDSEISDMTDFEADTSLDNLDTSLSGLLE